ncbi:MAG: cysteine hydrolase [Actinomycetota bacterium]|nr:cysteine hydrolase [Actinomycetota bacterium]
MDLRTAVLLVVDVQNGFVTEDTEHVVPAIQDLTARWDQADGTTIYSRYFNYPGSPFERLMNWRQLYRPPDTDIVPELTLGAQRSTVIDKETYSAFTDDFVSLVRRCGWTDIVVCGIDTDLCVLTTVFDAFGSGITPWIVTDCSASTGGLAVHDAALLIMGRGVGEERLVAAEELLTKISLR